MRFPFNVSARQTSYPLSIDSTIGSDSDVDLDDHDLVTSGDVVRQPGVRYLNHSVVPPSRPCSKCFRKTALFLLTNTFMSVFLLAFGIGISLGPGIWSLVYLEPKMTIDKSLKAFTIPNHRVMRHADALIVAVQHTNFRLRKKRSEPVNDSLFDTKLNEIKKKTNSDIPSSPDRFLHDAIKSLKDNQDVLDHFQPSEIEYPTSTREVDLSVSEAPQPPRIFRFTQKQLRWRLQLAYVARDPGGNLFTPEHLETIHKIERSIMNHKQFTEFCFKLGEGTRRNDPSLSNYKGCAPPNSLLSYFFPSKDADGVIHYDGLGNQLIDVDNALKFAMTYESFYYFVGDQFNITEKKGNLIHAEIVFGAPLQGYIGLSDRRPEQDAKFKKFIISYIDLFEKASTDKVQVLYGGSEIFDYQVDQTFWSDMHLAEFSIVSIVVIMFILTSFSVWLTWWGLVTIVLSFPLAIFFYRVVFGITSLGILNGAAAFVIIGIGVDDVFVFINIYRQLNHVKDDGERMIKTVQTAGKATLFTSFTTAAAFAANVASSIPAIHDFGLFMALMVACCWIMVVLIMPPAINIWNKSSPIWQEIFNCCGKFTGCFNPFTRSSSSRLELPEDIKQFLGGDHSTDNDEDVAMLHIDDVQSNGLMDLDEPLLQLEHELSQAVNNQKISCDIAGRFQVIIYHFIAIPVIKGRWVILALFSVIFVVSCVLVPQLHVATRPPQLFKADTNLQQFYDLQANLSNSAIRCDTCSGLFTARASQPSKNKTKKTDVPHIPHLKNVKLPNTTRQNIVVTEHLLTKRSEKSKPTSEKTSPKKSDADSLSGSASKDFKPCGENNERCKHQAEAPTLETDAAVFVVFGIHGIDRSNVSNNHVLTQKGKAVYDPKFENAFKKFPRKMPDQVIKDLCTICKMFANNTDLVKPHSAQCLPQYGIPLFLFNRYKECVNLPKNHLIYHQQLPVRALMGFNRHGGMTWMSFAFESTTKKSKSYFQAYKDYLRWEKFISHIKNDILSPDSPLQSIYQTSKFWEDVLKEIVAVSSAIYGLVLSLFICTAAVAIFTGHILLLLIIFMTIVGMILLVVGVFFVFGWEMGATEAVSLSILVGSSVDYCVHLVEGYILAGYNPPQHAMQSKSKLRQWRASAAASHIGVSIISSAITTIVAAVPLTQTTIQPFARFGEIVTMNTTVSILYTMTVCMAFLSIFGPANFTSSWKSTAVALVITVSFIGVVVLILYVLSVCGIAIPGPSGEFLFN